MLRSKGLALVVAGVGVISLPPSAQGAAPCQAPGTKLDAVRTVSADRILGGKEVTEYDDDGSYVVTRCALDGRVELSQHVMALPSKSGRRMLPVSTFISDGSKKGGRFILQEFPGDEQGFVLEEAVPPAATAASASRSPGAVVIPPTRTHWKSRNGTRNPISIPVARAANHCGEGGYDYSGLRIYTGFYPYYARTSSMPGGDATRHLITLGHHTWNNTISPCGWPDVTNISAAYYGATSTTAHSEFDGINVVDFGDPTNVGCSASATACTIPQTQDGVHFSDIDQRYNISPSRSWYLGTGTPGEEQYDLWSTASHESGHAVGLGHVGGTYLTMYPTAIAGATRKRDLNLGDAVGLRCRYGVTEGGC